MPKNKSAGKHPSYSKRGMSKEAIENKKKYDSKYQANPARVKYREELNRINKERGTYGNGDKKDVSHTQGGGTTTESQKSNRARNGANGRSTKKKK